MAESFSVKAILSAKDSGFSSTLKSAQSAVSSLGSQLKSGIGFGILQGVGQQAFSAISNGVKSVVDEINSSNVAWKTFEGNMKIIGKGDKEIKGVQKTLQSYAQKTIYSSSDMASSYSQLAAVGIKSADKLVTGFGGLAGAAENPAQAMKTLSQQGVQMAAKPTVAWQDFKLMLEQTPAGIAAVAKEMGMTTSELVTAVQDGEVATTSFFKAVEKVGNSEGFTKLATEYKSVDQAMDGLKETLGNKLMPTFDMLSKKGIKALSGIIDKLGEVDADKVADKVSALWDKIESGISKCTPYVTALKTAFSGVGTEIKSAFDAVKGSLGELMGSFGSTDSVESFQSVMQSVANAVKKVANFVEKHSDSIAKLIKYLPAIVLGIKGLKIAGAVAPGLTAFTKGIAGLAGKGISGIASKLFGVSKSQKEVGNTSAVSGAQMLNSAKSYALMGVAVLLVAAGFGILAYSAIQLANAGGGAIAVMGGMVVALAALGFGMAALLKYLAPMSAQLMPAATAMLAMGAAVLLVSAGFAVLSLSAIALANSGGAAIAVMAGMVVALAGLMALAAALGPAMSAGAVDFIAFGGAIALVGVGALLTAASLAIVASVLPAIVQYGTSGAVAILALGGSMIVFAAGAAVAAVGVVALSAALLVAAVPIAAVGAALLVVGAALTLVSVALLLAGTGFMLIGTYGAQAAAGLTMVCGVLPEVVKQSILGAPALAALGVALVAFGAGALTASVGTLALGAALAVVSVGVALLAVTLPMLTAIAGQSAVAFIKLGGGLLLFAPGATAAGAACAVLGAGLAVVGVSIAVVAVGVAALAVSIAALAIGITAAAVSFALAAASIAILNLALPGLAANGGAAAGAMLKLSGGLLVIGSVSLVASAALLALSGAALAASVGIGAFGGSMTVSAAGVLIMAAALKAVNSSMKTIAKNAKSAEKSLNGMQKSVDVVQSGLDSLGDKAKAAMDKLTNAFDNTVSKAQTSGKNVGMGFSQGFKGTMSAASAAAMMIVNVVNMRLKSGRSGAYSAGLYISQGFALGMRSQLGAIQSAAAQMVAAADKAVRAKAKIHSPSKLFGEDAEYCVLGFVNNLKAGAKDVYKAAYELISIPRVATPAFAGGYSGELSEDFDYTTNARYVIHVPLSIDGREFAKAEADYMQDELNTKQKRENRKRGKV